MDETAERSLQVSYPAILVFCAIGTYTPSATLFDVWPLIGFGALGYIFLKLG